MSWKRQMQIQIGLKNHNFRSDFLKSEYQNTNRNANTNVIQNRNAKNSVSGLMQTPKLES